MLTLDFRRDTTAIKSTNLLMRTHLLAVSEAIAERDEVAGCVTSSDHRAVAHNAWKTTGTHAAHFPKRALSV